MTIYYITNYNMIGWLLTMFMVSSLACAIWIAVHMWYDHKINVFNGLKIKCNCQCHSSKGMCIDCYNKNCKIN